MKDKRPFFERDNTKHSTSATEHGVKEDALEPSIKSVVEDVDQYFMQAPSDALFEHDVGCPYCGEVIEVIINIEDCGSDYIEDCQVCCRPIIFTVTFDGGEAPSVFVRSEDESY